MTTDFTPHIPQRGYTATIKLTCTRKELSALYDLLIQAEPNDDRERRIKNDVLDELRSAYHWLNDMEEIASRNCDNNENLK
jgi:hypothetical protein